MAQYNGYRFVPHDSYDQFRNATYGNGYNVDYQSGNQCWDYIALLYWQYGLFFVTRPSGNGSAYMCWTISRNINSQAPFVSIEGANNIRRGDILVFNKGGGSTNGHVAIADEDYNGSGYIYIVGENQGGYNGNVNRTKRSMTYFLGIFRNTRWTSSPTPPEPPTPTPSVGQKTRKFPWAIALHHWDNFKH